MGRPRAIQGEVEARLLEALESGLTIRLACRYAGVSQDAWEEERKRRPDFAEQASRARLKHLPKALDQVREAGKDDWRAAAKFAELVAPEDYGRQRLELSGPGGGPIETRTEVAPGFIADVLRLLGSGDHAPAEDGSEQPVHPSLPDPSPG